MGTAPGLVNMARMCESIAMVAKPLNTIAFSAPKRPHLSHGPTILKVTVCSENRMIAYEMPAVVRPQQSVHSQKRASCSVPNSGRRISAHHTRARATRERIACTPGCLVASIHQHLAAS